MTLVPVPRHALALLLCAAGPSFAQTAPAGGDLLRETERANARPAPATLPPLPAPQPTGEGSGPTVRVEGFVVTGATLVDEATLQAVLRPWVGRPASLDSLRRAADAVAQAYRERGWLARATLPEQQVSDGRVRIAVVEGRLAALRIDRAADAQRALPDDAVRAAMLARQRLGEPVRAEDLQRAVTLLDETPGTHAASLLEPGDKEGETRLVVAVKGAPLVSGSASLDNSGAVATGEARATLNLALNGALRRGDQGTLTLNVSTGSRYARAGASLPLGVDGWRAAAYLSALDYGYDLSSVRYSGTASVLGAALSYPLQRSAARNLSLALSLDRKGFHNAVAGVQLNDKRIDALTVALNGDRQDEWLGGGLWIASLQATAGRLDLAGNDADLQADQAAGGPGRQGRFDKLTGSLTRLQRITARTSLSVALSAQHSGRNLDSAEKFQVTGPYGVRAYGVSEPSADNGVLLTVEGRLQLRPGWAVSLFHDRARIERDAQPNSATLSPNRYGLAGSGASLAWEPQGGVQLRVSVAWRQGENPARNPATQADSDGTRRSPRVFASLAAAF